MLTVRGGSHSKSCEHNTAAIIRPECPEGAAVVICEEYGSGVIHCNGGSAL